MRAENRPANKPHAIGPPFIVGASAPEKAARRRRIEGVLKHALPTGPYTINYHGGLSSLFYLLSLLCLLACRAESDPSWEQIQAQGFIRVGMEASWVPFEYIDGSGQLTGLDVEMARTIGERLGVEVQFLPTLSFDGLYDALAAQQVDIIISAVVIDPSRTADYVYSTPYFDAGQVLVTRPEWVGDIGKMKDLEGHTLAVELGSEGDRVARYWARRLRNLSLSHHDSIAATLEAVTSGQADAALTDRTSALMNCAGYNLRLSARPVTGEQYTIVALKENGALVRAINDVLVDLKTGGELDRLTQKWLCEEKSCCAP